MERKREKRILSAILLAALCAAAALVPSCSRDAKPKKTGAIPGDIHGYRIGMTANEVEQLLQEKNVKRYRTGFSDLFVYDPSPADEVRLRFACGAKDPVLGEVEFSRLLAPEEVEADASLLKDKLIAEYGIPSLPAETEDGTLDLCWGQCGPDAGGVKLEAKTTALPKGGKSLTLALNNDALFQECARKRRVSINKWLYGWIAAVQKFDIGMPFKDVSSLYEERYGRRFAADVERDDASQQDGIEDYTVKGYDFFNRLDYESLAFEGEGPGTIVLKFAGDRADGDPALHGRLYYSFFSTTKFTDRHLYDDMQKKLNKFVKFYGTPAEVIRQKDGLAARWRQNSLERSVSIHDSGLIIFEQSDTALRDADREPAVKRTDE